jgi:hypothetical protein
LFAICSVLVMARSAIYLLTKRCVVIGLWKESSCIAFCLTYQMDHKVIATLMKSSLDSLNCWHEPIIRTCVLDATQVFNHFFAL